jgi:hypothetical protein
MKIPRTTTPPAAAVVAKHQHRYQLPVAPASNAALNRQNRKVMAQHYRAKYGVK